jgi:hypothetical protein
VNSHPSVPYAAINHHGVIGDRRTSALVAADGAIDWFSLLDYDGNVIFGCLLDAQKGGYWHLGPGIRRLGTQRYIEDTTSLTTTWELREGRLELTDAMAWPDDFLGQRTNRQLCLFPFCLCLPLLVSVSMAPHCWNLPAQASTSGLSAISSQQDSTKAIAAARLNATRRCWRTISRDVKKSDGVMGGAPSW